MSIQVVSTSNMAQTIDSVSLPPYARQKRASATAAIIAASAARTLYYSDMGGDPKALSSDIEYINTTGQTNTLPNDAEFVKLRHAGTIAALTIVLPTTAGAKDQQEVTVTSVSIVTTLTVSAGVGSATLVGAPTTIAAGGFFTMKYEKALNTWFRVA